MTVICTECMYCRIADGHACEYYVCVAPENQIQDGVSKIDGHKFIKWRSDGVGETRGSTNLCGPYGAWYKPIDGITKILGFFRGPVSSTDRRK